MGFPVHVVLYFNPAKNGLAITGRNSIKQRYNSNKIIPLITFKPVKPVICFLYLFTRICDTPKI